MVNTTIPKPVVIMLKLDQKQAKQQFIEVLADFLTQNAGGKSMALELEARRSDTDIRPKFAQEWAKLRQAVPLQGHVDRAETIRLLEHLLK